MSNPATARHADMAKVWFVYVRCHPGGQLLTTPMTRRHSRVSRGHVLHDDVGCPSRATNCSCTVACKPSRAFDDEEDDAGDEGELNCVIECSFVPFARSFSFIDFPPSIRFSSLLLLHQGRNFPLHFKCVCALWLKS